MMVLRVAQRLTVAIFCANYITMLALNCLLLRPQATPWIFFPSAFVFFLAAPQNASQSSGVLSPHRLSQLIVVALGIGVACAGIRWAYLAEPLRHRVAFVVGDDALHLQELNSLVNSARYPVQSSFVPTQYLSFYYAAWMPAVALYFVLPFKVVTLSTALFAMNALYDLLLPLALLAVALPMARSGRQLAWAVYLVGLWSGVQGLFAMGHLSSETEWVLRDVFGMNLQYSNFATLMICVVHHLCSAVALLLAYSIWKDGRGAMRTLVCALLLVFSMYSSAFVFLGAAPFLIYFAIQSFTERPRSTTICAAFSCALALPLLWIFFNKPGSVGFQLPLRNERWITMHRGLVLPELHWHYGYLTGVGLFLLLLGVQFWFVPWAILRAGSSFTRRERVLGSMAALYLLSTYFVGFSAANNYCMRGGIVPIFVLCWIASAYLPPIRKPGAALLLLIGTMGTWQSMEFQVLRSTVAFLHPVPWLVDSAVLLAVNQDRSRSSVEIERLPRVLQYPTRLPYYVEKLSIRPWPVITSPDEELMTNGPWGPWRWQRHATTALPHDGQQ